MEPVILINSFLVEEGKEEECLRFWERVAEYMKKQPGFIATQLHEAVVSWAKYHFINMAQWESIEQFETVIQSRGFKELTEPYEDIFPHFPGLYQVVRT